MLPNAHLYSCISFAQDKLPQEVTMTAITTEKSQDLVLAHLYSVADWLRSRIFFFFFIATGLIDSLKQLAQLGRHVICPNSPPYCHRKRSYLYSLAL